MTEISLPHHTLRSTSTFLYKQYRQFYQQKSVSKKVNGWLDFIGLRNQFDSEAPECLYLFKTWKIVPHIGGGGTYVWTDKGTYLQAVVKQKNGITWQPMLTDLASIHN